MHFEVEDIDEEQLPNRPTIVEKVDNLEGCGCSSQKFVWCMPLPRVICCGFVSLRQAIIAVTVFDMTTFFTSIVIFLYMFYDKGAFKNKYYLYLTLVLRLCINVLIGIVATVSLNVVCCNCYVKCLCMHQSCYSQRWRIFKVYLMCKWSETLILPLLDAATLFLAEERIEKLNWIVWTILAGQCFFRLYCTYMAHGYSTRLERNETLLTEYCARDLNKMMNEVRRLKGYRNVE